MYYQVLLHMNTRYKRRKHMANTVIDVEMKDIKLFKGAGTIVGKVTDESPITEIIKEEKEKAIKRLKAMEDPDKALEKLYYKLIEWLLFNLGEIKSYIREMKQLDSVVIFSLNPAPLEFDPIGKNLIRVEDAKAIINSIEKSIQEFDSDTFDIYIDRYHHQMIYQRIADFEELSLITVKRAIKRIRESIKEGFERDEISFDNVLWLRRKLHSISNKKAS